MVSDKKSFKDLKINGFVAMATRVFEGIIFFLEILKRTMAETFLCNYREEDI